MSTADIVQKLWNYCNALRDDGMSYGDYVEQLTYLLFLKMADERKKPPYVSASLPVRSTQASVHAQADGMSCGGYVKKLTYLLNFREVMV